MSITANDITAYMVEKNQVVLFGDINIVYIEGMYTDFTLNADRIDEWNDLSLIITPETGGKTGMRFASVLEATTEPGLSATNSTGARKRGGVFRIEIGQQRAWKAGYHKRDKKHPALAQHGNVWGYRDLNRDGIRTGDKRSRGYGINQHSTDADRTPLKVGRYSEGCLVRRNFEAHVEDFMPLIYGSNIYQEDKNALFYTTVIDGSDLVKWLKAKKAG